MNRDNTGDKNRSEAFNSILGLLQRLCSARELCTQDIYQRLKKYDISVKNQERIVESLKKDKFISDSRFAFAYSKDKAKLNGWGPVKIRWGLRSKGIDENIITSALEQIPADDTGNALNKIIYNKYKTLSNCGEFTTIKARLIRFAVSRGFDYHDAIEAANKILANFDADKKDIND